MNRISGLLFASKPKRGGRGCFLPLQRYIMYHVHIGLFWLFGNKALWQSKAKSSEIVGKNLRMVYKNVVLATCIIHGL